MQPRYRATTASARSPVQAPMRVEEIRQTASDLAYELLGLTLTAFVRDYPRLSPQLAARRISLLLDLINSQTTA